MHVFGEFTQRPDSEPPQGIVIGLDRFFGGDFVIHDLAKLLEEGQRVFGKIDFAAKQSYASFSLAKEAASVDGLFHWRKSPIGPSRHFGAMQNLVGIGAIADIE